MIPLSSAIPSGLTWSRHSHGRAYEFKLTDEVVGTLNHTGFWSCSYMAETREGRRIFRRAGWWGGAEIIDEISQQTIATLKSGWGGGGALTVADGQTFKIVCHGWWRPVWSVIAGSGQPVVHLHVREKKVELPEAGERVEGRRLSLLILFVLYRMQQTEEDAAAAAVMAAS